MFQFSIYLQLPHSHRKIEDFLRANHIDLDGVTKFLVELDRCHDIEDDLNWKFED